MSGNDRRRTKREFKNPDHTKTAYGLPWISCPDRFAGWKRVEKVQRRVRPAVEDQKYKPDFTARRLQRQLDIWFELSFNGRYRRYSPYGGVCGWNFDFPKSAEAWTNRKIRTYRKIYPGPKPLTGVNERRRAERRARYEKVKSGKISTDSILTAYEQALIPAYLNGINEINFSTESETKPKEERTTSIKGPQIQPAIARILADLNANDEAIKAHQARADHGEVAPPESDFDFGAWNKANEWEERRQKGKNHNRRLERALIKEGEEPLWRKPGDQVEYL
ncbi:hypothetical protein AC578_10777 [Pseudocercospora eumusae]|uniref:Uncharacterized protein n=1 Tax=Pseudocercospora eumusae TaxID=321146 RepID=A0A139GZY7_9PEZI|nr:hypothetical protein AC578_10777 [Pseudocercospora eumusae]